MSVWVHHMFAVGMSAASMSLFSAASMILSVFSTIQVFAWLATLWHGRPVMTASLYFALGFIALFVIGGLTGVVTALIPFDWQITDTYFVVAHLHYVLLGANVFPVFAALYYWLPKMTGRLMNERAGIWSFWLMFVGFNLAFFPMHLTGLQGMPRRIYTYPAGMGWEGTNLLITFGSLVLAVGVLVSLVNFISGSRRGALAGPNPWNADTLEWATDSPPAVYASTHIPTVVSRHPLWDAHDEEYDPRGERILDEGRLTLATTWRKAEPAAISQMPEDTATPLLLGLALTGLFSALLLKALWMTAAFAVISLIIAAVWFWPEPPEEEPA
jgi:heme/copper-type cytochrome/quinol oxidase subunit 1